MRKRCKCGLAAALALVIGIGLLPSPAIAAGAEIDPYSLLESQSGVGSWEQLYIKDDDKDEKKDDQKDDEHQKHEDDRDEDDDRDDDRDHDRDKDDDDDDDDDDRDHDRDKDDDDDDRDDDHDRDRDKDDDDDDDHDRDKDDDDDDHDDWDDDHDHDRDDDDDDDDDHRDKDKKHKVTWVERIDPPDYALSLYDVLSAGVKNDTEPGHLIHDSSFTLPTTPSTGVSQNIVQIERVDFDLADLFASEGISLGVSVFEAEDFYQVNPALSDQKVDYAALQLGDVVQTATFNGIFVTSILKDDNYTQEKETTCSYISTVYQAFDRDHPEVFWLSGKCRVRITVVRAADGTERAYFFLVLVDKEGFTMRAPEWTADGAVAEGLQRREAAVAQILDSLTVGTPSETVRQLNQWLTEHNGYNTTPDLTTISNEPHECLSALEGRAGSSGPVCDGYARAFKVLCDRLEIPCILENGYAKTTPDSAGSFHMWNAVKIGTNWYGVDITWNDPIVQGVSQAKSGQENEEYLLIGSSTVIHGMPFSESHPATNRASYDGVAFDNGPLLCGIAYALPFSDVAEGAWYYDAVSYMYQRGLMRGTASGSFSPDTPITRQQFWTILARASGEQVPDMEAARTWAIDNNVSDGSAPTALLTREQLVSMLWRYSDSPASQQELDKFTDRDTISSYALQAMGWAVEQGVINGVGNGAIAPQGGATRAQAATILQRFLESKP